MPRLQPRDQLCGKHRGLLQRRGRRTRHLARFGQRGTRIRREVREGQWHTPTEEQLPGDGGAGGRPSLLERIAPRNPSCPSLVPRVDRRRLDLLEALFPDAVHDVRLGGEVSQQGPLLLDFLSNGARRLKALRRLLQQGAQQLLPHELHAINHRAPRPERFVHEETVGQLQLVAAVRPRASPRWGKVLVLERLEGGHVVAFEGFVHNGDHDLQALEVLGEDELPDRVPVELYHRVALRVDLAHAPSLADRQLHWLVVVGGQRLGDDDHRVLAHRLIGSLLQPHGRLLVDVVEGAPRRRARISRVVVLLPDSADPQRLFRRRTSEAEPLHRRQAFHKVAAALQRPLDLHPLRHHRFPRADATRDEQAEGRSLSAQQRGQQVVQQLAQSGRQGALHLHAEQRPRQGLPNEPGAPRPLREVRGAVGPARPLQLRRCVGQCLVELDAVSPVDAAAAADDEGVVEAELREGLPAQADDLARRDRRLVVLDHRGGALGKPSWWAWRVTPSVPSQDALDRGPILRLVRQYAIILRRLPDTPGLFRGQHQRRPPVPIGHDRVRPQPQQSPDDGGAANPSTYVQRRLPLEVANVDAGAQGHERAHHVPGALVVADHCGGGVQRRAAQGIREVDVREVRAQTIADEHELLDAVAVAQADLPVQFDTLQHTVPLRHQLGLGVHQVHRRIVRHGPFRDVSHDGRETTFRRDHESGATGEVGLLDWSASLEQHLDYRQVVIDRRHVQRCAPGKVGEHGVRPRVQQQAGGLRGGAFRARGRRDEVQGRPPAVSTLVGTEVDAVRGLQRLAPFA
mmetsp:Transcript_79452/g.230685  ORF Transcript_79452/g.230685 Transcript_79452/m.230685 type:complete len:799 (+) Transcript_79452:899-3295(+)